MKTTRLHRMALLALATVSISVTTARGQATSAGGELVLGIRAESGTGVTTNYVVDLGNASVLRDQSTVQTLPLAGMAADLAATYGAGWHARTDLFWGVVANTSNFSTVNSDPPYTLYATKAETTNGTLVTSWDRASDSSQSFTTTQIGSFRTSGFNSGTAATNASTIARTMPASNSNSWSRYMPGGSLSAGISFQTWSPTIEGTPSQYLDLFRIANLASGDPVSPGTLVARLVLGTDGSLTVIPGSVVGKSTMQFNAATFSAAENVGSGTMTVTVTRTGDTTSAATINISTADGTGGAPATAPTDYTTVTNQAVNFAAGETSKDVAISIVNRSGTQGDRSFSVALGGANANNLIGVQGTATCTITEASIPSVVSLSQAVYTKDKAAGQPASTIAIGLTRTGGSDALSVTLTPSQDSGDNGVAGTDFDATPVTANFLVNSNTATGTISLPAHTVTKHVQFHVTVSSTNANPTIGTQSKSAVRLLIPDTTQPTVTITAPNATSINETASHNVTIAGTATDLAGIIDHVELRFNGGASINASTLTSNSIGASFSHTITWDAGLTRNLIGGLNTVVVQAFDAKGNGSGVVTKTFTYVIKRALNVVVAPNSIVGTLKGLKVGVVYQVGMPLTLTATAMTGFIFDHWSATGLSGPATELALLNTTFTDAMAGLSISAVPTITATFVATPFAANVIGEFNGLVIADGSSTPSNATNGMISTLKVLANGTFTGTLKIDGFSLPLAGSFDNTGVAKFGASRASTLLVSRTNKPSYELALHMFPVLPAVAPDGSQQIKGTLKQRYRNVLQSSSDITLDRAFYSATNTIPVSSTYLANKGVYNFAFPAKATQVGLTSADYPQGDGFGTLTVTNAGKVTLAATLADGTTKVTASSSLSKALTSPLYTQLYTNLAGSIGGLVTFNESQHDTDVAGTNFFWFRPWMNVQYYPWGWPEGINVDLVGTHLHLPVYTPADPIIPGLPAQLNNATLTFSDGQFVPSSDFMAAKDLTITFPTTTSNMVTNVPSSDTSFKLTITNATATFTGDFAHSDGTRPKFSGIILQKGLNNAGFGFFQTTAPKTIDGQGETGAVTVSHK